MDHNWLRRKLKYLSDCLITWQRLPSLRARDTEELRQGWRTFFPRIQEFKEKKVTQAFTLGNLLSHTRHWYCANRKMLKRMRWEDREFKTSLGCTLLGI